MSEYTFLKFGGGLVVFVLLFAMIFVYRGVHRDNAISDAIERGTNPVAAACAFDTYTNDDLKKELCSQVGVKEVYVPDVHVSCTTDPVKKPTSVKDLAFIPFDVPDTYFAPR
jgi:hypothetical protein